MSELKSLFKGGLRPRRGYSSGGDPLARWKSNMINLALKHQRQAKSGGETIRKSWHEMQPDGSYIATLRLNHCPVEIAGENCWTMTDLSEVVTFYDVVIEKLKTSALDLDIIHTALTIKSMKREALSIMKDRFPESFAEMEVGDTNVESTVAGQP